MEPALDSQDTWDVLILRNCLFVSDGLDRVLFSERIPDPAVRMRRLAFQAFRVACKTGFYIQMPSTIGTRFGVFY